MQHAQKANCRILIVDDEPSVSRSYKMILKHFGYDAQAVDCGQAALEKLEHESFDLVITDFFMPGIRGDELIAEIKRKIPAQHIILTSAFGSAMLEVCSCDVKPDLILDKPCDIEVLFNAITKVISGTDGAADRHP